MYCSRRVVSGLFSVTPPCGLWLQLGRVGRAGGSAMVGHRGIAEHPEHASASAHRITLDLIVHVLVFCPRALGIDPREHISERGQNGQDMPDHFRICLVALMR